MIYNVSVNFQKWELQVQRRSSSEISETLEMLWTTGASKQLNSHDGIPELYNQSSLQLPNSLNCILISELYIKSTKTLNHELLYPRVSQLRNPVNSWIRWTHFQLYLNPSRLRKPCWSHATAHRTSVSTPAFSNATPPLLVFRNLINRTYSTIPRKAFKQTSNTRRSTLAN